MKPRLFIEDLKLKGRRVLVRVDFNVPLDEAGKIMDNSRITAALTSICRIIEEGGRGIIMSHLGRPKGKRIEAMSLLPAADELSRLLGQPVPLAPDCIGAEVEDQVRQMNDGDLILLENLRFYEGETKNEPEFCASLARLGEVYVTDAFGTAHRPHASNVGVAELIKDKAVGYLVRKELDFLGKTVFKPAKPFTAILGGAKVTDKIRVIERLMERVQSLIIGGGMACIFLKAQGHLVGASMLEKGALDCADRILELAVTYGVQLNLPVDVCIARELTNDTEIRIIAVDQGVPEGWKILDIGPASVFEFNKVISSAKTILWNGPMGVFEIPAFSIGTLGVTEAIANATSSGAISIVGGGDSVAAVQQFGLEMKFSHISTGGGASLEFLEGRELPGLSVIPERTADSDGI